MYKGVSWWSSVALAYWRPSIEKNQETNLLKYIIILGFFFLVYFSCFSNRFEMFLGDYSCFQECIEKNLVNYSYYWQLSKVWNICFSMRRYLTTPTCTKPKNEHFVHACRNKYEHCQWFWYSMTYCVNQWTWRTCWFWEITTLNM